MHKFKFFLQRLGLMPLARIVYAKFFLLPKRLHIALSYYWQPFKNIFWWTLHSRECANFTYDLEPANKEYLASFVANITHTPVEQIKQYIQEVETDITLRSHISSLTQASELKYMADKSVWYGRRIGWYAFVRAKKPKVVVETGTDKGLGSCVLAAALMKNTQEDCPGYLYTTDIDPGAGYLLQSPYNQCGKVLYGDSIESIEKKIDQEIDIFINDSDHSADYEAREYEAVAKKLSPTALILGDNAHYTNKLSQFANHTHRNFLFFQEKPKDHWYPGAGIGVAYYSEDKRTL